MPVSNLYAEMMMGVDPEEEQGLATPTDRAVFKPAEQHIPREPFDIGSRPTPTEQKQKIKRKGFDISAGQPKPDISGHQVIPRRQAEPFTVRGGMTPPAGGQTITRQPFNLQTEGPPPNQSIPRQQFNVRGGMTPPVAGNQVISRKPFSLATDAPPDENQVIPAVKRQPFNVAGGMTPAQQQQAVRRGSFDVRGGMTPAEPQQAIRRGSFDVKGDYGVQSVNFNKRSGDNAQGETTTLTAALTGQDNTQVNKARAQWGAPPVGTQAPMSAQELAAVNKGRSRWGQAPISAPVAAPPVARRADADEYAGPDLPPRGGTKKADYSAYGPGGGGSKGEKAPIDARKAGNYIPNQFRPQHEQLPVDVSMSGNYVPYPFQKPRGSGGGGRGTVARGGGGARRGGGRAAPGKGGAPAAGGGFNFVDELSHMGEAPDVNLVMEAGEAPPAAPRSFVDELLATPELPGATPVPQPGGGGATRPRRVGNETEPTKAAAIIDQLTGGGETRNRYYNAEDQYKYENEIRSVEKPGFWDRFKRVALGAGMGLMTSAQPDSRGHFDLGRMIGGMAAGGAMGGIKPQLADAAYNRLIIGPEAERERAKQVASENIKFDQQKQQLGLEKLGVDIGIDRQTQTIRAATEARNAAMDPLVRAHTEAQTKDMEQRRLNESIKAGEPSISGGYSTVYNPKTGTWSVAQLPGGGKQADASQFLGDFNAKQYGGTLEQNATAEVAANPQAVKDLVYKLYPGEAQQLYEQLQAAGSAGRTRVDPKTGKPVPDPYFTWGEGQTQMFESQVPEIQKRVSQMEEAAREQLKGQYLQKMLQYNQQIMQQQFGITPRQAGQAAGQAQQQQGGGGRNTPKGPMRALSSLPPLSR